MSEAHVGGRGDAGVQANVGGHHRLPPVHRQPDHPVAGRQHERRIQEALGLAGSADHLEAAGVRHEPVERGGAHLQGAQHHVRDALAQGGHVEGLGEEAPYLRERLRGAAPALALREEPGVADRDRGVARQHVDDLALLRGGLVLVGERHAEHAHQLPRRRDGDAVVGLVTVIAPHRRDQARVAAHVAHEHGAAALRHRVGDAVPERDHRGQPVGRAATGGDETVAAPLRIDEADHAERARTEGLHRLYDLVQHRFGVEDAGDGSREARDLAQPGERDFRHCRHLLRIDAPPGGERIREAEA